MTRDGAWCVSCAGVRHLLAAYDLREDKLYGHIKPRKTRTRFLEFCRYLRSLYPSSTASRSSVTTFSPHLTMAKDARAGEWAAANNVEIAYTPAHATRRQTDRPVPPRSTSARSRL
jgi:hypothetical protein